MTKTILVVDDEPELRSTFQRILAAAGFGTLTACDGQEALDLIEGRAGDPPDAIVLDLEMPRVTGWQVIGAIRSQRPFLLSRILVVSGRPSAAPRDVQVLQKQSSADTLVDRLRALMALPAALPR
jgi:CheY-like chemotaxis protein